MITGIKLGLGLSVSNFSLTEQADPDGLSLDLAFALDKTLTARKGPTPTFTRASTATFVGSDGLIQSAATDSPRFDHDPVTLASKGLLIEESRTNLISHSENFANSAWSAFASATASSNQATSPNGAETASRLTAVATASSSVRQRVRVANLSSGSSQRTASAFIKAGTHDFGFVSLSFNKTGVGAIRSLSIRLKFSDGSFVQTGTIEGFSASVTPFQNDWYRITISGVSDASLVVEDNAVISVGLSFNKEGDSGEFVGTETIFAWGAQLEAGSFPTSYIPTTTTALTRSADVCSITGADFTGMYSPLEGSVISEGSLADLIGNNRGMWGINNNTALHGFLTFYNTASGGIASQSRNTAATSLPPTFANSANTSFKRGLTYYSGGASISTNGATATDTVVTNSSQTMLTLQIGNMLAGAFYWSGHIASIRYYKKRLANAKLQALTT